MGSLPLTQALKITACHSKATTAPMIQSASFNKTATVHKDDGSSRKKKGARAKDKWRAENPESSAKAKSDSLPNATETSSKLAVPTSLRYRLSKIRPWDQKRFSGADNRAFFQAQQHKQWEVAEQIARKYGLLETGRDEEKKGEIDAGGMTEKGYSDKGNER